MNYERRTLTVRDKDVLYSELLKREEFGDRINNLMISLGEYLSDLLRDYIIDKEIMDFYRKAGRIMFDTDSIIVTGESLGLTNSSNDFPNDIVTIPDYNSKTRVQINSVIRFYLTKSIPKVINQSLTYENICKIPKDKLDVFRENFLDILKLKYEKENFLIDYFPGKAQYLNNKSYYYHTIHFLHNKTTWSQVKKINEDWYKMLIENDKAVRVGEKVEKKELTPEEELKELKLELNI